SNRDGDRGVYVARRDGTDLRRISGDGFAAIPSWSPDGSQLTFVRGEPNRPEVWNLWRCDLNTGELQRLTSHRTGQIWGASWFPDGQRISYGHERELVILTIANGTARRFRSPRANRAIRASAVSPEGR